MNIRHAVAASLAILLAVLALPACEPDKVASGDATTQSETVSQGDPNITIKKPAYPDGTLETVLRHEGAVPIRIDTESASASATMSVDGGAPAAMNKASNYGFESTWTIAKSDNGAHTLTFTVVGQDGKTTSKTHAVRVLVWDRQDDLDRVSFTGGSPVLEVDEARGQMWLLYRGIGEIKMAKKPIAGGAWTTEVVVSDSIYELADGGNRNPWHLSMALDSKGYPHFASVWDEDGDNMKIGMGYFSWNGTSWEKEMAVAAIEKLDHAQPDAFPYYSWEGVNTSVTLDKNDVPHIVYYRNLATTAARHNGEIWYATKSGAAWTNTKLTDDIGESDQPVGFDRAGLASAWNSAGTQLMVRFATHEGGSGSIKYALKSEGGWTIGTIDDEYAAYTWDRGSESSLVFAGGKWMTSFHAEYGTNNLYFATFDGSKWTRELVDAKGLGEYSALYVAADGKKYITYRGQMNTLRFAWNDGSGWATTELGIETEEEQVRLGDPGQTQVYVDANGVAHVAFYNGYKKVMEYWSAGLAD